MMPGPRNADCGHRMPVRHNRLGGQVAPKERENTVKKMVTVVIGGALLARKGETMTTAEMVTYAYDQIDQARAELNAVSK